MNCIRISSLKKVIKNNLIYENVNMELKSGNIYGIVGANGSGKTMLFRTLAGLIKPTSGEMFLNDQPYNPFTKRILSVGIVIENIGLYPDMNGYENLKYLAKINNKINADQIKDSISLVGLDPDDKRKVGKYSLGMRQKIVLAQAIMEKPDFLLLDEPTNGLDEKSVAQIRNVIRSIAQQGSIILIASHNKEDISQTCDFKFMMQDHTIEVIS